MKKKKEYLSCFVKRDNKTLATLLEIKLEFLVQLNAILLLIKIYFQVMDSKHRKPNSWWLFSHLIKLKSCSHISKIKLTFETLMEHSICMISQLIYSLTAILYWFLKFKIFLLTFKDWNFILHAAVQTFKLLKFLSTGEIKKGNFFVDKKNKFNIKQNIFLICWQRFFKL